MCILGDQMLCLRYCFALCKINLFSVKPLWGFFFWYRQRRYIGCYRFQKNNMFLIVSKMEIFEKVSRVVCRFFIEN